MKDIGNVIMHKEKVSFYMLMEINMKEIGIMIKLMNREFILMSTGLNIRENGRTAYKMALELKLGKKVSYMKDLIKLEKNMAKANTYGWINQNIKENGLKTVLMERVFINGLMEEYMKGNG